VRQLGQAGHVQRQLGCTVGQDHSVHIHRREYTAHEEGQARLKDLCKRQTHPGFGSAHGDDARTSDRGSTPCNGAGREDQGHSVSCREDELVERLESADKRRERLAIVDISGPLLECSLPAGFRHRDLVNARGVVLVVRPGDDRFAGVGEHARKLVQRAQVIVNVIHRAQ